MTVKTVMNSTPVTLPLHDSFGQAFHLLLDMRVRGLPVVDAEGNLVGLGGRPGRFVGSPGAPGLFAWIDEAELRVFRSSDGAQVAHHAWPAPAPARKYELRAR